MSADSDDVARYRLSAADNERIFRDLIIPVHLTGYERQNRPVVVVLMAQPGAGKSKFARTIRTALRADGGAVEIDSDLYKPFHPQYAHLMRTDDQKMVSATRADGRAWMDRAQHYVRENRLHAIFHETAQDPSESMQTLHDYHAVGYRVAVIALGVHESQSQQGVLHRYREQLDDRGSGRLTVPANAERSYRGIAEVAAQIDESGAADLVAVYRRTVDTNGPAYINRLTSNGEWAEPPQFAEALAAERSRPLSADEVRNFHVVQDRLRQHRIRHIDMLTPRKRDQVTIGVAAYENDPLPQRREAVEHGDRLRTSGMVAGDDHEVGIHDLRLDQHGIEHGQDPVDIGQDRHGVQHAIDPGTRYAAPIPPSANAGATGRETGGVGTCRLLAHAARRQVRRE